MNGRRRLIGSWVHGSMANAMPQCRPRQSQFCGDGEGIGHFCQAARCDGGGSKARGPALLDVVIAKQELSMPPTITPEEVKGFSVWLLRAVMNSRGDEVIDLARTNLLPR